MLPNKDELQIIWEYEPMEDIGDRLLRIFEFLLEER
jgi:hypothetical protein